MIILTKPSLRHIITETRETMTVTLHHNSRVFSAIVSRACSSSLCCLILFRDSEQVQKIPRIGNTFTETVKIAKMTLLYLADNAPKQAA